MPVRIEEREAVVKGEDKPLKQEGDKPLEYNRR
jgi:hypothetical protein